MLVDLARAVVGSAEHAASVAGDQCGSLGGGGGADGPSMPEGLAVAVADQADEVGVAAVALQEGGGDRARADQLGGWGAGDAGKRVDAGGDNDGGPAGAVAGWAAGDGGDGGVEAPLAGAAGVPAVGQISAAVDAVEAVGGCFDGPPGHVDAGQVAGKGDGCQSVGGGRLAGAAEPALTVVLGLDVVGAEALVHPAVGHAAGLVCGHRCQLVEQRRIAGGCAAAATGGGGDGVDVIGADHAGGEPFGDLVVLGDGASPVDPTALLDSRYPTAPGQCVRPTGCSPGIGIADHVGRQRSGITGVEPPPKPLGCRQPRPGIERVQPAEHHLDGGLDRAREAGRPG